MISSRENSFFLLGKKNTSIDKCPCFHFSQCNALLKILKKNLLLRHSSRRSGNEMHDSSSQQAKKKNRKKFTSLSFLLYSLISTCVSKLWWVNVFPWSLWYFSRQKNSLEISKDPKRIMEYMSPYWSIFNLAGEEAGMHM